MSSGVRTLLVLLLVVCAPARASEQEEVRERMAEIFQSIRFVLPMSVNEEAWRDPANAETIRSALQTLASNAALLATHATGGDAGFEFLGDSLTRHARETLRRFDDGRYASSEFLVQRTTEFCIACHARLPAADDSPLSAGFIETAQLGALPIEDRAYLLLATRQFDAALGAFEELVLSPEAHPAELLGPLTDYLTVNVRVKSDFVRPLPTLDGFAHRADLWRYLRADVEHWMTALRAFEKNGVPEASLAEGRRLIEAARQRIGFPADRQALVHYIVASSVLHRFIEQRAEQGDLSGDVEVAEAYYLLGVTETRIGRDFWVSQAENYLEAAIRLAPAERFSERAYGLLEEETVLGYSGSGGINIPEDVSDHLASLRRLIDGARQGGAESP